MTLDEAVVAFTKICKSLGLDPKIERKKNTVVFYFKFDERRLRKLLDTVANVADIHGGPPEIYILKGEADMPKNRYVKTGWYND